MLFVMTVPAAAEDPQVSQWTHKQVSVHLKKKRKEPVDTGSDRFC